MSKLVDNALLAKLSGKKTAPSSDVTTETFPQAAAREFTEMQKEFRDAAKAADARFRLNTDSEYWVCLCFPTRAHKEEFLENAGIGDLGDRYVDGREAAERLGVKTELSDPVFSRPRSPKTWARFVKKSGT